MIKVFIPTYRLVEINGRNKRYHTYRVEVHHNGGISHVEKRYSDFLLLHKDIRRRLGPKTPFFPPKKVRNNSVKVLEGRRTGLELYLQSVLTFTPIPKEILGFLNINQGQQNNFLEERINKSLEDLYNIESAILNQPAAGFVEDPYIESDTSSNISDTITRGVLDALYNV